MNKMVYRFTFFLVLPLLSHLCGVATCWGYARETHEWIASQAITLSRNPELNDATYRSEVMRGSWEADEKFYNSGLFVWGLYGKTAPRDHFMNPDTDAAIAPSVLTAYQKANEYWQLAVAAYPDKRTLAYTYLGHIAHLLADMAVPAHVLLDLHLPGDEDSYESYMKVFDNYSGHKASEMNKSAVPNAVSGRQLFYDLAQQAQYFPSNDVNGNQLGSNPSWFVGWPERPDAMRVDDNNQQCGEENEECHIKPEDLNLIADHLLPLAIKYSASLFDYFYDYMNDRAVAKGNLQYGAVNRHAFTITTPGKYVIYTRGELNTTGKVYDAAGRQVSGNFTAGGELDNFRAELSIVTPGTYYLDVSLDYPYTPGAYTLHIDGPGAGSTGDRDDHGMSAWNATPVTLGSVTAGSFELRGDMDFFRLSVTTPGRYVIYTRGEANTSGTILDGNSNQIGIYNSGGELDNFRSEVFIGTPGTYYVEVSHDYPTSPGTPYTLHVDAPGAGSIGNRDDHGMSAWNATPVTSGSVTSGTFELRGDADFFRFTVATPGRYVIYTRGAANTSGTILDGNSNQVAIFSSGGELDNFRAEVFIGTPGTYYVQVSHDYPTSPGTPYTLHVDAPGTGSVGDRDDHGMSAWNATQVTSSSVTHGTFELRGDRDFFKFTVDAPGRYVIYTRGEANTSGTILDGNSNQIGIYNSGGELGNFRAERVISTPGTYYVEVSHDYPTSPGTPYTLHIEGPPDTVPDDFAFAPRTNAPLSSDISSNAVIVQGITAPAAVTVSRGSFSINGAPYTTTGTVRNGDSLRVRLTSSSSYSTTTSATVTIGGKSSSFNVTTVSAPVSLTVTIGGTGGGSISGDVSCPSPHACSPKMFMFPQGTTVSLVALADGSSVFSGWSGQCTTSSICTFQILRDTAVGATFTASPKAMINDIGYASFAIAYAHADSTATILAQDGALPDALLQLSDRKEITLKGGYTAGYSSRSGNPTVLRGLLRIRAGKLTVERFAVR